MLGLELTLKDTVPLPDPVPEVMAIQLELVLADQVQPLCVFTEKLLEPPPEPKL